MNLDLFQLTPTKIEQVLARAMSRGGDFSDIFCEYTHSQALVMEEGILKTARSMIAKGVGIRVIKGEKTGYAYTEALDMPHLMEIADTAAAIAEGSPQIDRYHVAPKTFPNHYPVDISPIDVDVEKKVAMVASADNYTRSKSDKITKVTVSLTDEMRQLVMADSRGQILWDEQPMIRFNISVMAEDGDEKQQGRGGDGGRKSFDFLTEEKIKAIADKAVDEALLLLTAQPAPAGMLPVILGPGDSGILLHEAIGHPLEADFNRKKTSAYAGRIGEKVADSQCTIYDDGTVHGDRGAINVDDELNVSEKTVLIENGVLVSYMYDEMSARYFERESSGNGRRESYKYQPIPRMRTTYMDSGKYEPEEIITSTKKGIFCKTFRGGQVDISNGNFIFVPSEAYLVEDGKISHPVKNFSLIGNGPDVLSKVTMVGSDFRMSSGTWTCGKGQQVPVGVGLPTIKISQMTVGGSAG